MEDNSKHRNQLRSIRDAGPYCARNLVGGHIHEAGQIFLGLQQGKNLDEIRKLALDGVIFSQSAYSSRRRVYNTLHYRYLTLPPWIQQDIISTYNIGERSKEFLQLLYLYYILKDKLIFDLFIRFVVKKWNGHQFSVSRTEVLFCISKLIQENPLKQEIRESTYIRLGQIFISSLHEFGILEGKRDRTIKKPIVSLETSYHIVKLLFFEGKAGSALIQDPIWQIFLCSQSDVIHYLVQLDQQGFLKFEKTGKTVVLSLKEGEIKSW